MNRKEAVEHCRKMCEHIKGMDSQSDDWKAIHAILVLLNEAKETDLHDAFCHVMDAASKKDHVGTFIIGDSGYTLTMTRCGDGSYEAECHVALMRAAVKNYLGNSEGDDFDYKEAIWRARELFEQVIDEYREENDVEEDGPDPLRSEPDELNLLSVLADIRQKTGVGNKPMLSELADVLAEKLKKVSPAQT